MNMQCIQCGDRRQDPFVRLCNACFERGKKRQPPRQSGRTHRAVMALQPKQVYVCHNSHFIEHMKWAYPQFAKQFVSQHNCDRWIRGMSTADIVVDHAVWDTGIAKDFMHHMRLIGYFMPKL